jgi:SSS family solute:Na+ symporter
LAHRYNNKWVAVVAAIISFVMLIPYSSVQLIGAGLLVEGLTNGDVPYMLGVLVMAVLAGFAAWWAGMRSVAWTDAIQGLVMLVTSIIALLVIAYSFFGSPAGFVDTITREHPDLLKLSWSPNFFIGITLPWAFFALTNPQVSQRMYIPKTVSSLRRMILFFAVFGFLYTIISTLFGMEAAHLVPGLDSADDAMPRLLTRLPAVVSLILFIGIFAAASSTLGSIILTLSSLFARDVVKHIRPDASDATERASGRIALIVLLLACMGFAWIRPGLITVLSSMASGGLLVMAPAIIGAFFWKRGTASAALLSMIVGGVLTAVLYLTGWQPLGWWASVWGAIVTTVLFVITSLVTTPPDGAQRFIEDLEGELVEHGFRKQR